MAISVRNAKPTFGGSKEKPQAGRHTCRVKDIRVKSGHKGEGFRIDLSVVEGPTVVGFEFSPCVYPQNARAQGNLSVSQVQEREEGKIIKWLGAVLGLQGEDVFNVTQEVFDAAIVRPVSPYAGRLVVVNVVAHTSQRAIVNPATGQKDPDTVYYELYPVGADRQAPFALPEPITLRAEPPPVPKAWAPPPVIAPPAAIAPFPPPGWAPHTDPAFAALGWYYCGALVKHMSELGG